MTSDPSDEGIDDTFVSARPGELTPYAFDDRLARYAFPTLTVLRSLDRTEISIVVQRSRRTRLWYRRYLRLIPSASRLWLNLLGRGGFIMHTNTSYVKPATSVLAAANLSSAARDIDVTCSDVTPLVFVVDDELSVRESLELLMGTEGWRVETFASAADFVSRSRATVPCCLVLDIRLPGLDGLELQRQLAARADVPIIFLTGYGDVATTVHAMKAGACDFLTKPVQNDALVAAIRQALERSRAALLYEAELQPLRTRYASLTARERDVMRLVVSGLLNKQVGGELGISEITVKAHRGQAMRKMKADSLAALVTMAARLGVRPTATHRADS